MVSQSKSYGRATAEPRPTQNDGGGGEGRRPPSFLFRPLFSFRAAESLTLRAAKEKTHLKSRQLRRLR